MLPRALGHAGYCRASKQNLKSLMTGGCAVSGRAWSFRTVDSFIGKAQLDSRDPNGFHWKPECLTKAVEELTLECEQWRHTSDLRVLRVRDRARLRRISGPFAAAHAPRRAHASHGAARRSMSPLFDGRRARVTDPAPWAAPGNLDGRKRVVRMSSTLRLSPSRAAVLEFTCAAHAAAPDVIVRALTAHSGQAARRCYT